ncbi:unnamed protein product [Periconia digitata]|uniref:SET domain-containing protein n=1 Tax=Periconia digitata TaxID=1303443 RepID=A0A9W4UDI7_9PLEO|nr:unnamed protein product [Periconia digitata]
MSPTTTTLPTGAPTSPLFEIRETPHSGRAVFATKDIPNDTLLWRSTDLTLDVLLREYRREVCGECFAYDHGRDLPIRDQSLGFAFCTPSCLETWKSRNGPLGIQAWTAVEKLVKKRSKEDSEMVSPDLPRPSTKRIAEAWDTTTTAASLIRVARAADRDSPANQAGVAVPVDHDGGGVKCTKQHRKAVQKALLQPLNPDIISFVLSGILHTYHNPSAWPCILALASDDTPYSSADDLAAYTRTYLHLLAVLPLPLLPHVTAESIRLLGSRDSHNSFGIRSLEDEGAEFFGYGCWPSASYFNHSCAPSVAKRRDGRVWEFRSARDVKEGEELCITYLSGEERRLSRGKRVGILKRNWGFDCACDRCEGV